MSFGLLLLALTPSQKGIARKLEKLQYKLNNAFVAVDFLHACLQHGLLPKFTYSRQASSPRSHPQERLAFLETELQTKESLVQQLRSELQAAELDWNSQTIPSETRSSINTTLENISTKHHLDARRRIGRKLANLYGGPVEIPQQANQFINLSSVILSKEQQQFLNLGLNCHFMSNPPQLAKKIELEMLLDDIQRLEREKKVSIDPNLPSLLCAEATKRRGHTKSSLLTPSLRSAAKELMALDHIVIRRADKSSIYVILDKADYISKMNTILNDPTKFKVITRNPNLSLKSKLNKLIRSNNNTSGSVKLPLIEGDHKLGYAYGNVKTHKQGYPLRPIISQTPTLSYKLAKRLNSLITP